MDNANERAEIAPETAETIITRFEARFDQSLAQNPPSKEWVRAALDRKGSSRCPVRVRRLSYDLIVRHGDALADLFLAYPDDLVLAQSYEGSIGFRAPGAEPVDTIRVMTEAAEWIDEWGTRWGHAAGGIGATPLSNPIDDWGGLDPYLARLPDPLEPGRLGGAAAALALHGASKYFIGMTHLALFERLHCLRGMENTFEDLYVAPIETERLLDALTDYMLGVIGAWGRLGNVDTVLITDDWGSQSALMVSPPMWRRFFANRYRRLCDEAHRRGMKLMFHSCGHVFPIIGDLIDAGVDIIDPLQPETMNLAEIAREFGGKVAFAGGISDQRIASQTPTEVRDEVRRAIDLLGAPYGNAYMVAPSNMVMPDTPLENLEALFEACHGH
jgi:uroporphyrinogen decarboxylase